MRRLFQECKIGQGNANLLSEALAYAKPEDLEKKEIIRVRILVIRNIDQSDMGFQEFYAKCRSSQELIHAQIPWASAGAERSRQAKGPPSNLRTPSHTNGSFPSLQSREDDSPIELTIEEELLAALLASNEALLEALRLYDDLERVAVERQAEEISRRDVKMDRRVCCSPCISTWWFLTLFPIYSNSSIKITNMAHSSSRRKLMSVVAHRVLHLLHRPSLLRNLSNSLLLLLLSHILYPVYPCLGVSPTIHRPTSPLTLHKILPCPLPLQHLTAPAPRLK